MNLGTLFLQKKAGLLVEEFALGFPPRIFSKKVGETLYSINLIPFGGYVKIHGEDGEEGVIDKKRSFSTQTPFTKAKILIGGVLMNLIVAVFIFYIVLGLSGFKAETVLPFDYNFLFGNQREVPLIAEIVENSPAERAGLESYNIILSIDEKVISGAEEFSEIIDKKKEGALLLVQNISTKEIKEIQVFPEEDEKTGRLLIGVHIVDITEISYNGFLGIFFSGALHTANMTHFSFSALFHIISKSFTEKTTEPLKESVAGVVGIFAVTHIVLEEGIIQILNLIALISIALAVVNILPIPALDGGRLVFVAYEAVFKKQAPPMLEKRLSYIGFSILILLIIFVTYNDIIRFGGVIKEMF